ncbi:hypothetical protein F5Y11DRAFT_127831 [Daldinia sp. FL1419]|nr:hypothetical protein F5Y11DRAFT_127831 [Daldinia sp. FL1419]
MDTRTTRTYTYVHTYVTVSLVSRFLGLVFFLDFFFFGECPAAGTKIGCYPFKIAPAFHIGRIGKNITHLQLPYPAYLAYLAGLGTIQSTLTNFSLN